MSKRPVSFIQASPRRSISKPSSEKQRRNQMRERLRLRPEKISGLGRSLVTGEDLMVAGTVFLVTFLGAGAWLAS